MMAALIAATLLGFGTLVLAARRLRHRGFGRWLFAGLSPWRPAKGRDVHLLLCIADHYEPLWNNADEETADARVEYWVRQYPALFDRFRDSDGRPPRHTFFYPIDQYRPDHVESLARLCRAGYGEIEVHLHHDNDTAANLESTLREHVATMAVRHGVGATDRVSGARAYGFIHGDWALDNSRPDGRCCGVNNELDVLRHTGCYADFTLPSYPNSTQTRTTNRIYYTIDDPKRPKSHDRGLAVGTGPEPGEALLMIQGPLLPDWSRRKWGIVPRIENGCIQANQPAGIWRLNAWLRARVQVPLRPDWYFVKLHTHGAPEANQSVLLGHAMVSFHRALAERARDDPRFHYHYVTAREMYNLVKAAEAGWTGSVAAARDHRLVGTCQREAAGCSAAATNLSRS